MRNYGQVFSSFFPPARDAIKLSASLVAHARSGATDPSTTAHILKEASVGYYKIYSGLHVVALAPQMEGHPVSLYDPYALYVEVGHSVVDVLTF